MYSVERVDLAAQLEKIYRLRVSAWQARVPHFPDIAAWTDEYDSTGLHWAIWSGDQPIAAARLTIHDRLQQVPHPEVFAPVLPPDLAGPIAVLTRLVVDPDHGGKGLSRLLDEVRIAHATQMGCQHVIGSTYAGQKRLAAMQAMGFEILGEAGLYASGPLRAVGADGGGGERPPLSATTLDGRPEVARPTVLIRQINPANGELGSAYFRVPIRPAR